MERWLLCVDCVVACVVWYTVFVGCCVLSVVCCLLFTGFFVLFSVCVFAMCVLFVVCRVVRVVRRFDCCLSLVVWCW